MDVRGYFQKIRSLEEALPGDQVVVASLATADGGREGRLFELTRSLAAKMIVEKKVRLATEEESARHREYVRGETADVAARAVEPQAAFLAEISTINREVKKQRKR